MLQIWNGLKKVLNALFRGVKTVFKAVGKALAFILFMYCAGFFLAIGASDGIVVVMFLKDVQVEIQEEQSDSAYDNEQMHENNKFIM